MTETQAWIGIFGLVVSVAVIIWRMSAGFSGVRADIRWLITTNDKEHSEIKKRILGHSTLIGDARDRVAALEGRLHGANKGGN